MTSIPRYVLVKYATRGLVVNGKLSPLFDQLYIVITTTFTAFFFCIGFMDYFGSSSAENPYGRYRLTMICLNPPDIEDSFFSIQIITIWYGIYTPFLLLGILMFLSVIYITGNKSRSRIPTIFGRYQRNVLTFKQTLFIGFLILNITNINA